MVPPLGAWVGELAPHWELGDGMVHSGYIPHDLYTGQSIASHLLNGGKALKRFDWPSGATGYLYRMHDGRELAAFWKTPDAQNFTLHLPPGDYERLDMYLNPLPPSGDLSLSEYPQFLRGKDLQTVLKQAELTGERSFRILSAHPVLENGKTILLLNSLLTEPWTRT